MVSSGYLPGQLLHTPTTSHVNVLNRDQTNQPLLFRDRISNSQIRSGWNRTEPHTGHVKEMQRTVQSTSGLASPCSSFINGQLMDVKPDTKLLLLLINKQLYALLCCITTLTVLAACSGATYQFLNFDYRNPDISSSSS